MRGRKPFPQPELPPKGHFRVSCEAAELMRDGRLRATDVAVYLVLAMFAWDGQPVRVSVETLAEWVRISREAASRSLGRLAREGLVERLPDGRISVIPKSRDFPKSRDSTITEIHPPIPPHEDNMVVVEDMNPPPPHDFLDRGGTGGENSCDPQITGIPDHVISKSRDFRITEIPAVWRGVAAQIGVTSADGVRALAQSGIPPRRLLALWEHHRAQRGGPGVGAFLANLRENPEGMAALAERLQASGRLGPPICPRCGGDARRSPWDPRPRGECPACGARLRECARCWEMAEEGPCPWCGADPPDPAPEGEGEAAFPEALRPLAEAFAEAVGRPAPVREPERSRWIRELEAIQAAGIEPELLFQAARRLQERGRLPNSPGDAFHVAWDLKGVQDG
ncbi:helix-turn-helix domain-containing protein [Thermoflexus sp.]|uniref:helix-turn-helix domain-containing protein n=1 Tax=Thermoflexus sp. TaxID=1969742 RepID=UPI0035E41BFB